MFQLPFSIFMMRISFEAVPREIEESALVDGCGSFGSCGGSCCRPRGRGSSRSALFAFLAAWNDFIAPLILHQRREEGAAAARVANLRQQTMGVVDYGATEAGVVVLAIPCLVLFFLLQRHYVRGFMSGAVKG